MNFIIRKINTDDKVEILSMMKVFYSSNAVYTNGSDEIFEKDFTLCVNGNPYLYGYVFCAENKILGYAMIAKSFSTEFGKQCIWFEDLYVKPEYRGQGIVSTFIEYIKNKYPDYIFKLEVEEDNSHAMHVYEKKGFKKLPYKEMCANY